MQVQYSITQAEWKEAVRLFRSERQRPIGSVMMWVCIGAPLLGSVGDLVHTARASQLTLHGSVLPVLGVILCVTCALLFGLRQWQERKGNAAYRLPEGEWEIDIREDGLQRVRSEGTRCELTVPVQHRWEDFAELRVGRRVFVLLLDARAGFEVLPLRAFSTDQVGWLKRLVARKVRPPRPVEESRTGLPFTAMPAGKGIQLTAAAEPDSGAREPME